MEENMEEKNEFGYGTDDTPVKQEILVIPSTEEECLDLAEKLINEDRLSEAQDVLDKIKKKSASKFFIQSKLYNKRGWYNEQRKQLKRALKADPYNQEYKAEWEKLEQFRKTDEYKTAERQRQMGEAGNFCTECACACCCEGACEALCEGLSGC